jgi:hypothetical protein
VERADKPGSVLDSHSSGMYVTVHLKQPTRIQRGPRHWIPIWSCSEWGLPSHRLLPAVRCALTAPFHPYRPRTSLLRNTGLRRFIFCCTFRRLAPPRRYLALCPVEPGLSSSRFPGQRLPGPLRAQRYGPHPLNASRINLTMTRRYTHTMP